MTKEYEILTAVKTRLTSITGLTIGFYPDDYIKISSYHNLPAVLIQMGNSNTLFHSGRKNLNRMNISVLLYHEFKTSRLSLILEVQTNIVDAIIADIQYDGLVSNIYGYTILVGDVVDFVSDTQIGMNGKMTVHKLTFDFEYWKEGIS